MNPWQIAWRNLMRRKLRTFLTILSIVIGVASTFGVIAAINSAEKAFPVYIKSAFGKEDFNIYGTDAYFSDDIHKEVEKLETVDSISIVKENTKLQIKKQGVSAIQKRVKISGYSNLDTPLTNFKVVEGSLSKNGAVITDRTAKTWESKVGDTISFETDQGVKKIKISAIVKYTSELMGPSSWSMAKYHHWSVAVPINHVQEWFGLEGKVEDIQVKAKKSSDKKLVESQLEEIVDHHEGIYMQPSIFSIKAEDQIDTFFLALYIAGFLGIALSAFIIFNSLYVSIKERRKEFAAMKTIGFTPAQLQMMVMFEVILFSVIGTLFGLLLGYGLAIGLKTLIFMIFGVYEGGVVLTKGVLLSVVAGLVIPFVAAYYPIRDVGRISVIESLKENKAATPNNNKWLAVLGLLLIVSAFFIKHLLLVVPLMVGVALVFPYLFKFFGLIMKPIYRILFGFTGEMATRNLNRNLSRTSMTSLILCLGITMIVLMSSLNSALLQTYERVIYSSYGGNLDIMFHHTEKEDLNVLKNIKGVADAETYPVLSAIWTLDGEKRKLPVLGVGEEWIDRFPLFVVENGSHSDIIKQLNKNDIVLDQVSFNVWGGKIGETITLETLNGNQEFVVAAVVDTMKDSGYGAFMSEKYFKEHFGLKYEKNALVIKDENTSPVQLRERIFDQFGERIEEMFGPEDMVSVISAKYTGSFSVINGLIILAIIVSGIGITNTLLINIMERIREIGMMRAIGITRGQVIRMILLEGFGIGLTATIIGAVFGILLIYITSSFMKVNSLTFEFGVSWWIIGLIMLFGIITSVISSFTPASRASKTNLSEAIRYE